MGDINFAINSLIDVNKVVNFDINKNVTTTLDLDGQLATATADAEAFGSGDLLAETTTFTIVQEPTGGFEPGSTSGQLLINGNTTVFSGTAPGDDIAIGFTTVDDADSVLDGLFKFLEDDPAGDGSSGPDIPLPAAELTITDLNLVDTGNAPTTTPGGNLSFDYINTEDFIADFGTRNIDLNDNGVVDPGETGALTLSFEAGREFDVIFNPSTGAVDATLSIGNALFTFDPDDGGEMLMDATVELNFQVDSLGQLGEWNINAIAEFPFEVPTPGTPGSAFSFSESISAAEPSDMVL